MKHKFVLFLSLLCASICWGQNPNPSTITSRPLTTDVLYLPVQTLNPVGVPGGTIQLTGTPGQTTYYFWASANFQLGSIVSYLGTIQNAPNTLSVSNYVTIYPNSYPAGVTSVDILATTTTGAPTGACNCAVATGLTSGGANFQSNSLSSYTVSILNPAAYLLELQNEVTGAGAVSLMLRNAYTGTLICNLSTACGQTSGGGLPTAPQTGDTVCYNCNGDSAWDAVNYARPFQSMYAINQTATLNAVGVYETNTVSVTGSTTDAAPTATLQSGKIISASASASTNTVLGATTGSNGNTSLAGMLAFYRWSARMSMGNTTNVRYWQGLACYNNSGTGSNGTAITASAAYASDTPNKSTIAFMYDPAINTHWQAVAITAGASSGAQTTVDTGVVEDTAIHLFEMTTNSTGTSVTFWIDGTSVATISTNLPPPANGQNSAGQLFFTGDNKNTATAIAETFYSMQMALKQ